MGSSKSLLPCAIIDNGHSILVGRSTASFVGLCCDEDVDASQTYGMSSWLVLGMLNDRDEIP